MSNPILPSAILADFVAAIKAIVPAETGLSSARFTFVRSREQVEGAGLRTFTLEIEPTGDGPLTSCGNDYVFALSMVTSYRGLQRFDAQCMIAEDNRQIFQTIAVPGSVPFIITGMRLAVGRALIGVVVGELYAATAGVGYLITVAGATFQTDKVFVGVMIICFSGLGMMEMLRQLEKHFEPWRQRVGSG